MGEYNYIEYFETAMAWCMQGRNMVLNMVHNLDTIDIVEYFKSIKELSDGSNDLRRDMIWHLHREFIPIFEREDVLEFSHLVHSLMLQLENIVKVVRIFNINKFDSSIFVMADVLDRAVNELANVMNILKDFKVVENISQLTEKVKIIESECDVIYIDALTELYAGDFSDMKYVLSSKELLKSFEEAVDACERVAYFIEVVQINNI